MKDPLQRAPKDGIWFAWYPVTTREGYAVWLEKVERVYQEQVGWYYYLLNKASKS
jgi:hypothetical protein